METGESIADVLARLVCVKAPSQNEATLDEAQSVLYLQRELLRKKWRPSMMGVQ